MLMMMMIFKNKYKTRNGYIHYVMWMRCFGQAKKFQYWNFFVTIGQQKFDQLIVQGEPSEVAITTKNIDIHIESTEIQIERKEGRTENPTLKRKERSCGTLRCICSLLMKHKL